MDIVPIELRCHYCKKEAVKSCDFIIGKVIIYDASFKGSIEQFDHTCSKKVCEDHAITLNDKDYCRDCIDKALEGKL